MRFLKVFFCTILIFLMLINVVAEGTISVSPAQQKLIEEILTLDARVLALRKEVDNLSQENQRLKKSLKEKRSELILLDEDFKIRQEQLSGWIVFSYKGGIGNLFTVLVGAEDLGDFFRRLDNIMFFLEYYNNIIVETKSLINRRKQEELSIMEKQREIQDLEDQTRAALEKLTQTIAEKQRELQRAKLVFKDTTFLEEMSENWQQTLPSLDYLLRNISKLPWSKLSPDNLKVNYFALTAQAEFHDTSITKTLLSQDKNLKNVYFTFSPEGITVIEKKPNASAPTYSILCTMELTQDQKIKFAPKRLDFSGVTLPADVIKELMSDYNMVFTPPPLPYDLQITSISTEQGKLIMNFKK